MKTAPGSFRDPSGQVFEQDGNIYRTITEFYKEHWEKVEPFLKKMAEKGLVVPFEEVEPMDGSWKTIKIQRLPFISYPYEWSFDQMKDAALLTLRLQKLALKHGLVLKDGTAYNIQFLGRKPIFIDHLSFEIWEEGKPWIAYKQFCQHFLAPIALSSAVDLRCNALLKNWIDGIPLDVAAAMMPKSKKLSPLLYLHLFLHAKMQGDYSDTDKHAGKAKATHMTADQLSASADSLINLLKSKALKSPDAHTEWGDYYTFTNYSDDAAQYKLNLVAEAGKKYCNNGVGMDLGANTGHYTRQFAPYCNSVIAADIDPVAVNRHYRFLKESKKNDNIVPIIMDFGNPSPNLGFNCAERESFMNRCNVDFMTALAIIHHIRITAGIPVALIAEFFASLIKEGGVFLLEFVPKEDSQTMKLLALREDIFSDYTLDQCVEIFSEYFECLEVTPIEGTLRHMITLKRKA